MRFRRRFKWVANSAVYGFFGSSATASLSENNEEIEKWEAEQV